jgi:hypothetical protein
MNNALTTLALLCKTRDTQSPPKFINILVDRSDCWQKMQNMLMLWFQKANKNVEITRMSFRTENDWIQTTSSFEGQARLITMCLHLMQIICVGILIVHALSSMMTFRFWPSMSSIKCLAQSCCISIKNRHSIFIDEGMLSCWVERPWMWRC